MGTTSPTRATRSTNARRVPSATPPPQITAPAVISQEEAAQYRDLARNTMQRTQQIADALKARGITLDDLLKPADPYANLSTVELAAKSATDPAAHAALVKRLTGETSEPEPEPDPLSTMGTQEIALSMAQFAADGNMGEFNRYNAEWQNRIAGAKSEPVPQPAEDTYGGYSTQQIRTWLLSEAGIATAAALGQPVVGGTGKFPEWGIKAAIAALNAQNGAVSSVPVSVPVVAPVNTGPVTLNVPTAAPKGPGGRGGNYSDDVNAWYLAEATKMLAGRGTTPMDVARSMSPQQWATLSLGNSQIKNGKHGDPWPIPNLEIGPAQGQPAITSNFKGSDTSFCYGMASWLANDPKWRGIPGTAGDGKGGTTEAAYYELARGARGDYSQGPTQKMWDRAAAIVARATCAGFAS